jgi:heme exporter protein D
MIDLGPYAGFIVGAYAVAFLAIAALIAWIGVDYRAQKRILDELESRGVVRGSRSRTRETVPS